MSAQRYVLPKGLLDALERAHTNATQRADLSVVPHTGRNEAYRLAAWSDGTDAPTKFMIDFRRCEDRDLFLMTLDLLPSLIEMARKNA